MLLAEKFIETGLSHIGCGYVFGANGEVCTSELVNKLQKRFDPNQTGSFRPTYIDHIYKNYLGKRVFDCSGLIVSICREMGLDSRDYTASSLYFYRCKRKDISDIVRGDLVFKKSKSSGKIYHVGIYLGDGRVLEAQGTLYGVKVNKLSSKWTLAGRLYVLGDEPVETVEEPYTGHYEITLKYSDSTLNLRSAPSGMVLSELVNGDILRGYGNSEYKGGYNWVKVVSLNTDEIGWVADKYLKKIDKLPNDR